MSFFTSFFSSRPVVDDGDDAGQTLPQRMNLEERMAYRREMLFEAIGFAMKRNGIPEEHYRLRVSRTDARGHAYAVMINLSTEFQHDLRGSQASLQALGRTIAKLAAASGLLEVNGVYWSVMEHADAGRRPSLAAVEPAKPTQAQRAAQLVLEQRIYASDIAPLQG